VRSRYALGAFLFFVFCNGSSAQSNFARDNFRDIRWLGRGNTGVATITDATAVFYNPGGIPLSNSYRLSFLNPYLAGNQNFYSSIKEVADLNSDSNNSTIGSKFSPFLGKPLGVQGAVFPSVAIPGFVIGAWDYLDTGMQYRNPVNPEFNLNFRNDYGVVIGSGIQVAKGLGVGASLRFQKRRFIDTTLTGGTVLAGNTSMFKDLFKSGEGWGVNLGSQYRQAINKNSWCAFGLAIEDLGYTSFRNQKLGKHSPLPQRMQINAGSAYGLQAGPTELSLRFDMRQLSNSDLSHSKKLFMGAELNLPFLVDLRAGFFQGYWTAGVSVKLIPFFDIDFTTYGEELDSAAGIRQSRMWMLGISAGLELKKTSRRKQRFTLDNL